MPLDTKVQKMGERRWAALGGRRSEARRREFVPFIRAEEMGHRRRPSVRPHPSTPPASPAPFPSPPLSPPNKTDKKLISVEGRTRREEGSRDRNPQSIQRRGRRGEGRGGRCKNANKYCTFVRISLKHSNCDVRRTRREEVLSSCGNLQRRDLFFANLVKQDPGRARQNS